jgi:hypothetical protein
MNNDINTTITDNDMRNAFEIAISIGGSDIIDGNIIWKRYRDFEIQEHLNNIKDGLSIMEESNELDFLEKHKLKKLTNGVINTILLNQCHYKSADPRLQVC